MVIYGIYVNAYLMLFFFRIPPSLRQNPRSVRRHSIDNIHSCNLEKRHVYFLKNHKCGSTTMFNMFMRFGMSRNLSVMIFTRSFPYPYVNYTKFLRPDPVDYPHWNNTYDIFCDHSIYNETYLMKKMPPDVARVAIVREPLSYLQSAFTHYNLYGKLNVSRNEDSVRAVLKNPELYAKEKQTLSYLMEKTKNRVSREFGFAEDKNITDYLNILQPKFLVLILELFDESLVVMRRKLCWSHKDIVYLKQRSGSYDHEIKFSHSLGNLYNHYSPYDNKFYYFFKKDMENQISRQGDDFEDEVQWFRSIISNTTTFCNNICQKIKYGAQEHLDRKYMNEQLELHLHFNTSRWSSDFEIHGYDCIIMMLNISPLTNAQKVVQWPDLCEGGDRKMRMYCEEHFYESFPWDFFYDWEKYFLFDCSV